MIKVTSKMFKRFLEIMDDYDEFVFGDNEQIKKQLELCLNTQGYWSGNSIRVYYNDEIKDYVIERRF